MKKIGFILILLTVLCSGCSSDKVADNALPALNHNSAREYLISVVKRYEAIPNISYTIEQKHEVKKDGSDNSYMIDKINVMKKGNKLREEERNDDFPTLATTRLYDGKNYYLLHSFPPETAFRSDGSNLFFKSKTLYNLINPRVSEKDARYEYSFGPKDIVSGYDCQTVYIKILEHNGKPIDLGIHTYCINEEYALPIYANGVGLGKNIIYDIKTKPLSENLFKIPPGYTIEQRK